MTGLDAELGRRLDRDAASVESPVAIGVGIEVARDWIAAAAGPVVVVTTERAAHDPIAMPLLAVRPDLTVWTGAHAHPGPALIERTTDQLRRDDPGTVVGLGGGSVLDLTKIAAAPVRERRSVSLIQIPTTSGTGAEVTCWGTYWLDDGTKQSFEAPSGFADRALIVPELTATMPARLTLATGLDAFVHAAEAIAGRRAIAASTALAQRAITLVGEWLSSTILDPGHAHRRAMAEAATLAGLALSVTRSAAAHALSYSLTGVHGLEHGLAVGLMWRGLLPELVRQSPEEMGVVFDALGVDSIAHAETLLDEWFAAAGLEPSLRSLGLPPSAAEETIDQALASNRLGNQPGQWGRDELRAALDRVG